MTELTELVKIRKLLQKLLRIRSREFYRADHDDKIADVKG